MVKNELIVHPLTSDRWNDLLQLFGKKGAYSNCWCTWFRLTNREFDSSGGEKKKRLLKELVDSEKPPGLLGYIENTPVAWISLGPRDDFKRLQRSRILKPVDEKKVWSIVCFFIHKEYRKKGFSNKLINEAIKYAKGQNAMIVESYPVDSKDKMKTDSSMYTGKAGTFISVGFVETIRRSSTRPIMRYFVEKN